MSTIGCFYNLCLYTMPIPRESSRICSPPFTTLYNEEK